MLIIENPMGSHNRIDDIDKPNERRVNRRDALATLGGVAPLLLLGCSSTSGASRSGEDAGNVRNEAGSSGDAAGSSMDAVSSADGATTVDAAISDSGECVEIPDETSGPYPDLDGMISNSAYNRSNITEGLTGTALTVTLQVLDVANGCTPIQGARVIIWQCDANGVYSEYTVSQNSDPAQNDVGSTSTTYLRGWQETDSSGNVTFTTIYPGWYIPRVTHIHVMVYNPSDLTSPKKTTQFALPDATNETVYAQALLYAKGQNSTTIATDQVFSSGSAHLVAAISGSNSTGYAASLPIGLESY
jgi:protocatechuate 3,4-dioxygenase beta subunit